MTRSELRLAAVGDLHCTRKSQGALQPLFAKASERADVLCLCGDLTDSGLPDEAHVLADELARGARVPVLAVFGNHDFELGHQEEIRQILSRVGVQVLDGDHFELDDVGFVGVKGFGGGFGRRMLEPWGEQTLKSFVNDAVNEALKLESALAKLRTRRRVALLHYAPIEATIEGEPREIYPFLGSSRLEEPLNRYAVTVAFHGHAHHGRVDGRTREGVPVYNVAAPLLRRTFADDIPCKFLTLSLEEDRPNNAEAAGP